MKIIDKRKEKYVCKDNMCEAECITQLVEQLSNTQNPRFNPSAM